MIPLKDNESPNNLHQQYYNFLESQITSKTPWQSLRLKAKRLGDKSKIDKTKHVYNHTELNETSFDLNNNVNVYSENLHKIKKFYSKRHRNSKAYHHAPVNNIYLRHANLNHEVEKSNPTDSFNKSMTNNIIEEKKQNMTTSIANRKFKTANAYKKYTKLSAIPVLNESDKLTENNKIMKHVIAKSNDNISTDFSYCDSINQIFTKTTKPKFRTHKSKTLSKIKGSQILENINIPEKNSSNDFRPKANSTVTLVNNNNNSTFNMPEINIDAIKKTSRFGWGKARNRDKLKMDEISNQIQIPKIIGGNDKHNAIQYVESDQKSIDSITNDAQTLKSTIKNRKPYSKIPKIRHLNKITPKPISTRALSKENGSVEQNDSLNDELNVTKFEPNTIEHHKTTAPFGKMHKRAAKENAFSQRIPKNNAVLGTPFITENSVESDNLNFDQNLVTVKSRPFGKMHKTNDINQTYNVEQSKNTVNSVSKKINDENYQHDDSSIGILNGDKTNLDNPIDVKKTQFGKVHKSKNTKQNNTNNIKLTANKNTNHHQVNTTLNDEINISNIDSNPIITLRPFGEKRKTKNIINNDKRTKLNAIDAVIKLDKISTESKLSDQNCSYVITNDEICDNQDFDENRIGKERQFSKMHKSNNYIHLKNIVENVPILSEKKIGLQGDSLIDEINTDNYQNVILKPGLFSKMHKVNNTTHRSNLATNIDQNRNIDNQTTENYKLKDSINEELNTTKAERNPTLKPQGFGRMHRTKSQIQVNNIQRNANEQHNNNHQDIIEKTHPNRDDIDEDVILTEQTFVKSMATHVFASKVKRSQSFNPHLRNRRNVNVNSKIDTSTHAINDKNKYTDSINDELNTTNANQNPTLKPRGFGIMNKAKSLIQVNNIRQNTIKHLIDQDIDNTQSKDDTNRDAILNEQTFVKSMGANAINAKVKRGRSFNPRTMNTNINVNSKIQMDDDSNMDLTTLENMKDGKSSQPYQTLRNKPNKLLPCRTNLYANPMNPENLAENKNDSDMTLICDMDGPINDVGKNKFNVLRNKTFKPQLHNLEAKNLSPFVNNTKRNNIIETEQTINTAANPIISQNDNIVNYNETYVVDTENYGKKKIETHQELLLPLPPVVNNSIVSDVPIVENLPLFNSGDQHNENDAQGGGTYTLTTNTLSDFYSTTNKSSKNTVRIHKNTHNLSFGSLDKMSQMYQNRPSTNQETKTMSKNTANSSKLRSRKSVRISTIEHHIMPVESADNDCNNDNYYSNMLPRQIKDRKSVFTSTKIGGLTNTHSPMSVKTTLKGLSTYLNDDMTKTLNENSLNIDNEQRSLETLKVPDEIMVNKTTQHTGKISTPRPLTRTKSLLLSQETNVPLSIITRKRGNNVEKKMTNPYESNDWPTTSTETFDNFVTINSPSNEETLTKEHRIRKRRRKPLTQVCRDIRELITTDYLRREKLIDIADKVFPDFRNLENYDELMPLVLSKCEEIIDLNINAYKKVVRLFPFTEPYNLNILEFYLKDICNFSLKDPIFTKMTKFLDPKIRKQLYKTMREDKDTTL